MKTTPSIPRHPSPLTKTLSKDGWFQACYGLTESRHHSMHLVLQIIAPVHLQALLTQLLRVECPQGSRLVGLPLHTHPHTYIHTHIHTYIHTQCNTEL